MSTITGESEQARAAKQRVEGGLDALRVGLAPYVANARDLRLDETGLGFEEK